MGGDASKEEEKTKKFPLFFLGVGIKRGGIRFILVKWKCWCFGTTGTGEQRFS
jgi:hypothetical protein